MFTRREAMAIGGTGVTAALAGCETLTPSDDSSDEPPLSLRIINYTHDLQDIKVEIIDPDVNEYPEAVVYRLPSDSPEVRVEIPPAPEGEAFAKPRTFKDIAETRTYTVRSRILGDPTERWRHFHYKPMSNTDDHFIILRIYKDKETNKDVIKFGS